MPLVRISLLKGRPPAVIRKLSDAVHRALVETIPIPELDSLFRSLPSTLKNNLCTTPSI